MEKSIITTGKTLDLAIEAALKQLNLDRDSVSVEIIENAKSGFLGIGAVPAKVKVTYEAPDEETAPKPALSSASRSKPKMAAAPIDTVVVPQPKPAAPIMSTIGRVTWQPPNTRFCMGSRRCCQRCTSALISLGTIEVPSSPLAKACAARDNSAMSRCRSAVACGSATPRGLALPRGPRNGCARKRYISATFRLRSATSFDRST